MLKIALSLLEELNNNGFEAYIVGGFARDCYMNKDSSDVDVATNAKSSDLKDIFPRAIFNEEKYGSGVLFYKGIKFEITTYRKEKGNLDNRFPLKIEYTDSLVEDLKRRDFVINTLCIDKNGDFVDVLNARKDIDNKLIKTVGDPYYKMENDALRMLRAIRFKTVLNFEIENETLNAIKEKKELLKNLSFFRKKEELNKIFSSEYKGEGIKLLCDLSLDKVLGLKKLKNIVLTDNIGIWAQLNVDSLYPFNKKELRMMKQIRKIKKIDDITLYKNDLYILQIKGEILGFSKKEIVSLYQNLPIKTRKELKINSEDILNIIGEKNVFKIESIYEDIEEKIINKSLKNNKDDLIKYINNNYN